MKRDSVIFLCTGNICRSPMGEGLLKHAIAALPDSSPLKTLRVLSAGTFGEDGMRASSNSIIALDKVGVDISRHVAQSITQEMLDGCFALVAMTQAHLDTVRRYFKTMPPHSFTLLSLVPNAAHTDILDPYGYGMNTYIEVRDEIISAIPHLVKFLEKEYK